MAILHSDGLVDQRMRFEIKCNTTISSTFYLVGATSQLALKSIQGVNGFAGEKIVSERRAYDDVRLSQPSFKPPMTDVLKRLQFE